MIQDKTIAITRSLEDSAEFISLANRYNAKPISLPTIQLVSKGEKIVDEFLDQIKNYNPDYSIFMSSKAVKLLFDTAKNSSKFQQLQLGVSNTIVISVGPKTREALQEYGIKTAYMPNRYSSVGVGEVFTRLNAVGKKVIIPRSSASKPFLKDLLNKIGLDVSEIHLYDVCAFDDTSSWNEFRKLFSEYKIDGIIFTSVSSVKAFFEIMTRDHNETSLLDMLSHTNIVAIGPFTASELERFKVKNTISLVHTVLGAFDTIRAILA